MEGGTKPLCEEKEPALEELVEKDWNTGGVKNEEEEETPPPPDPPGAVVCLRLLALEI